MIKYVFQNLKSFFTTEPAVFVLTVLSIYCASIMLFFSFGFYHHLEQKKLDGEYGEKVYWVNFYDRYQWTYEKKRETALNSKVRKGVLMEMLFSLESVINNCDYIGFDVVYPEDVDVEERLDMFGNTSFCIEDGQVVMSPEMKGMTMKIGRYFTEEEYRNGELVCTGDWWIEDGIPNNPDRIEAHYKLDNPWLEPYMPSVDGTYQIGGKTYVCIGNKEQGINVHPEVPVTTISDDVFVKGMSMIFTSPITRKQYEIISQALTDRFGSEAMIHPLDIREANSEKFYNTLIILCVFMTVLSAIVTLFLYQYILLKRQHSFTVFRMFGMTQKEIQRICFGECMFLTVVCFFIGLTTYQFLLMPFLSRYFEYIVLSYNIRTYTLLSMIYIGGSGIILGIYNFASGRNKPVL